MPQAATDPAAPARPDLSPDALAPRLSAFLSAQRGRTVAVSRLRRYPAGMSWITIGFTASVGGQEQELILRVGDPGGLLAPYRAEPEYLVLTALAGVADMPVPRAHAYSDDPSIIGAPFLITGRVDGDTPMPWKGAADARPAHENDSLGRDFADALGVLHAFDWRRSGLGRLWGEVDGATVARQEVARWARHAGLLDGAGARHSSPQMHYAWRWLDAHAPVARQVAIVHGDYRVGNFLAERGRITAILDWELMHPGDPHEDIAWAGLRTFAAGTDRIGGLISRDDFLRRYSARSGIEIDPGVVRYYEVLVQFKMAAMLLGAVRRIESGEARDVRMAAMGFQLAPTLLELNRLISEAA